jgi:AcrR family transcriptional regulator
MTVASRLFWKKGYRATTIDDIARDCRMNKAAIYYYFTNKTDILFEISTWVMKELAAQVEPIFETQLNPLQKLRAMIANHTRWGLDHPGPAGIGNIEMRNLPAKLQMVYVSMRDGYEAQFRAVIAEGIKAGHFKKTDPKLAAMFTFGLTRSIIHWFDPKKDLSSDDLGNHAADFVISALTQ